MKNIASHLAKLVLAASIASMLAACGGGGDSAPAATPSTPTTPQVQLPSDPYTGKVAAGTPTAQISGTVYNNITAGATVIAYLLNPDGSNGASLGSATTDAAGGFTMTLNQTPTGMIRLVATGGTFTSEADASTQKNGTNELVAPYVTTSLSSFVITPVTNVASAYLTYLAGQKGSTLKSAYTTASSAALQAVTGLNNIGDRANTHAGVDYLSIVPGSAQDVLGAYADALLAVEYYAADNDLPSRVAARVLAQSFESGSPKQTRADGSAINVGKWVGNTFDETIAFSVADMGHSMPSTDMQSIVQAKAAAAACAANDKTIYYARFPLSTGQSDYLDATACTTYTNKINAIKAKNVTNKRAQFVS